MPTESQSTAHLMLVRPASFGENPQTAASNAFQQSVSASPDSVHTQALGEWEGLVAELQAAQIDIILFDDTAEPHKPDAIFPNNWVSFHADGTVVLYPMEAQNRRPERRMDFIEALSGKYGFFVRDIVDFTALEENGVFLEGTGSMVLDRVGHIGYACISSRTHPEALGDFAQQLDYDIVSFEAHDRNGVPVYHTNLMMAIGEKFVVLCRDSIVDESKRGAVSLQIESSGRHLIPISIEQMCAGAGNILEVRDMAGEPVILMSDRARCSFDVDQIRILETMGKIVSANLSTIESVGGGSMRCMIGEVCLPKSPDVEVNE